MVLRAGNNKRRENLGGQQKNFLFNGLLDSKTKIS